MTAIAYDLREEFDVDDLLDRAEAVVFKDPTVASELVCVDFVDGCSCVHALF